MAVTWKAENLWTAVNVELMCMIYPWQVKTHAIKDSVPGIIPSITSIINSSFSTTSTFPRDWKIAEVSPILKEGDFEEPGNNRPISLLPILSKVCEKAVLNQLTPYLTKNKRLAVEQSGNKKWHPTKTCLIASTDTILDAVDKKELTAKSSIWIWAKHSIALITAFYCKN